MKVIQTTNLLQDIFLWSTGFISCWTVHLCTFLASRKSNRTFSQASH